jgi:hypothetical protein
MRFPLLLLAACLAASACSRADHAHDVRVGAHELSVSLPRDWVVADAPGGVVLAAPPAGQAPALSLHLRDLGPVTPDAWRRELAAIAELWQGGKAANAVERLRALRSPAELLPSLAANADFAASWPAIVRAQAKTPFADVEGDFAVVTAALDATAPPPTAAVTSWAVAQAGVGANRAVTARRKLSVGGREAEEIETRDTLAQGLPRRMALVNDQGRLLLVITGIVARDSEVERYQKIRDSIRFPG